jgi:LPXTG-site transpeptidase (sortase) family protein
MRGAAAALPLCEALLVSFGFLALAYYGVSTAAAHVYQAYSGRAFDEALAETPAQRKDRPANRYLRTPVGRLEIPSIDLSVIVLEGTDERGLSLGVGHIEGTAPLGARGNVGIAGHRDGFFRDLRSITWGDRIIVTTLDGRSVYQVDDWLVVDPKDVEFLASSKKSSLTLVTCYPFNYIGPAPRRFVVRASLAS